MSNDFLKTKCVRKKIVTEVEITKTYKLINLLWVSNITFES